MIYLEYFTFPDSDREFDFFVNQKRTCYDSFYPFQILSGHHFRRIDFEPVTILYGGNGSGKTTVLNVIGEKLQLARDSVFNKSNFFQDYLDLCDYQLKGRIPVNSRVITSDDVFDYMLNIRSMNEGIDRKKESLFEDYLDAKYADFQMRSLDDYERLKKVTKARRLTQSRYVRSELMDNIREYSNGEFLLAMRDAKIYDLDEDPADVKRWTELENVRTYYTFFRDHCDEFTD